MGAKDFWASGLGQVRHLTAATAAITLARLFVEMLCYVLGSNKFIGSTDQPAITITGKNVSISPLGTNLKPFHNFLNLHNVHTVLQPIAIFNKCSLEILNFFISIGFVSLFWYNVTLDLPINSMLTIWRKSWKIRFYIKKATILFWFVKVDVNMK